MQPRSSGFLAGAVLLAAGCMSDPTDVDSTSDDEQASTPDSVYRWTDDVEIGGSMTSPYQVGLASHGTGLNMVFTGNNTMLYTSHFTGSGWSTVHGLPNQSADYGPALADFNGALTTVYHAHGQNRLLMSTSTDGATWSTPVTAGTALWNHTLEYAPALAVHRGALYAAYCENVGDHDRAHVDRFDGTTWTLAKVYDLPITQYNADNSTYTHQCKHVALASLPDGRLDLTFTQYSLYGSTDDWTMHNAFATGTTVAWPSTYASISTMKSKKPPSITTCNAVTHLVHGGFSNPLEIWWSVYDYTAKAWNTNVRVPDQASDGGAALGCYNGTRAIMVHNGGYTPLWWSEYI